MGGRITFSSLLDFLSYMSLMLSFELRVSGAWSWRREDLEVVDIWGDLLLIIFRRQTTYLSIPKL
jgi:hypothetical protein